MTRAPDYLALAAPSTGEIEVSRSRFLAYLVPVRSQHEARHAVDHLRAEHPQARHHAVASRIGPDGALRHTSDDGEPAGTAASPMLGALEDAGVSDVLAVVVRYFGGVLLGTGGLARAYRGAVLEALTPATFVRRTERAVLCAAAGYADAAMVTELAQRTDWGVSAEYGERVELELTVARDDAELARERVAAATQGRVRTSAAGMRWVDLPP